MIIVGLTGGIGSGKTFIAQKFHSLGIPIYNSDTRARELMLSDKELIENLKQLFGSGVYRDQKLNKTFIAEQIFKNKQLLQKMNQLVHPKVQNDFEHWCSQHTTAPFVIKEAAILIESGAYKQCNYIIVILAPKTLRMERVMNRDNMSHEQFVNILNNQLNDKERLEFANFTIRNDGTEDLDQKVHELYQQIVSKQ
ncbi:MAG: dephospho-CoA kinase [Salinivirgaceae bacterium]